jgi:hypothetical protein
MSGQFQLVGNFRMEWFPMVQVGCLLHPMHISKTLRPIAAVLMVRLLSGLGQTPKGEDWLILAYQDHYLFSVLLH